tara:strand:- start:226 stop:450 length:225 start_codon:yes stop_codon:yes gene_type:complete
LIKEDKKINRKINNFRRLNLLILNVKSAIKMIEMLKSVDSGKYRGGEVYCALRNILAIGIAEVLDAININGLDL